MNKPSASPYGSWASPITASKVSSGAIRFDVELIIDNENIYWVEGRPAEKGRNVIVKYVRDGSSFDIIPEPFNVRTTVHEYGGGAFLVDGGTVYFSNYSDQRLYRQTGGQAPEPVTPEGALRYADGIPDRSKGRIICVCEDRSGARGEPENYLGEIDLKEGNIKKLVSGSDFYSSPCLSPDGARLAWLTWNHPDMPWDGAELWTGDVSESGEVVNLTLVAGGGDNSVCQPRFSSDGTLYFVWEKTGWWNLYRWNGKNIEPLLPMDAEFGLPHWVFGQSNYGFEQNGKIVCFYDQNGESRLARIDTDSGELENIETKFTSISSLKAGDGRTVIIAGNAHESQGIYELFPETGEAKAIKKSTDIDISPGYISEPEAIDFPTGDGLKAHAWFYRPKNIDFVAPEGELPPLIVISHGGPTSSAENILDLKIQFWTSRGFAVANVNYGGSTGYGRDYRNRLDGSWGVVDVEDCVNCGRYLAEKGLIDGEKAAIRGGSAGGYTTLAALAFYDFFKAGASYYGVSDLEALARDTHKFESRYLDRIVGPYPAQKETYTERSPINHVEKLSCPVIFFQGDEDKIVPPNQAEMMVEALRKKGIPVAYLLFKGEQHGFRNAENIKRSMEAELYFYSRIFGFDIVEQIESIKIDNLDL